MPITHAKLTVKNAVGETLAIEAFPAVPGEKTTPQDVAELLIELGSALGAATTDAPGFIEWVEKSDETASEATE